MQKVEHRGLAAFQAKLSALSRLKDIDAGLEVTATSGTAYGRKKNTEAQTPTMGALVRAAERSEGMRHERRSAGANMRIWNRHKSNSRNPFVYGKARGVSLWLRGAKRVVRGNLEAVKSAAKDVAEYMLDEVEDNIRSGSGMAPLSRGYGRWKARRFPGKPILELSGQLLRSLKPKVLE